MLRNVSSVLVVLGTVSALFLSGCGSSAQLSLSFSPDTSDSYKSTSEMIKDFRFEQPNLGKLKEEQTKTSITMEFTQTIQSVEEDGSAVANITIDELDINFINKNEPKYLFNSHSEKDKNQPMAKLLGQSYTIKISPDGQVSVVDTTKAISAVQSAYEKDLVKNILDPKAITKRHQIAALPKDKQTLSVKSTWSEIVPSPPGLLAPKTYEKTYTLASVDKDVATVTMIASESGEAAGQMGSSASGMGFFAKMFDNKDDYTGTLKVDVASGAVLNYDETLVSTYTAQEMPPNGDPEKGPDTLTMKFTDRISLEKLD